MSYTVKNLQSFRTPDGGGFNATLYRDGKRIAHVHDAGRGGCYSIDFVQGVDRHAEAALLKTAADALPQESFTSGGVVTHYQPDVDMLISGFVSAVEDAKQDKRLLKMLATTCMFTDPSKPGIQMLAKTHKPDPILFVKLRQKYPAAVILNELPPEQALALIKAEQNSND